MIRWRAEEMFTGIVEEVGKVRAVRPGRLTIAAAEVVKGTRAGDSISVNGACLTVTDVGEREFSIEVMPETLRRTNLGGLQPGQGVNVERAMAANGRFGGHFVQGHVDGTGEIASVVPEGEALLVRVSAPAQIMRYLVEKGFVAVDGISLTIVGLDQTSFTVSLVGYTRAKTTLNSRKSGDRVNLEVDIIAKYLERMHAGDRPGVSLELLGEQGFLGT
jgi:riboflavin synthase